MGLDARVKLSLFSGHVEVSKNCLIAWCVGVLRMSHRFSIQPISVVRYLSMQAAFWRSRNIKLTGVTS